MKNKYAVVFSHFNVEMLRFKAGVDCDLLSAFYNSVELRENSISARRLCSVFRLVAETGVFGQEVAPVQMQKKRCKRKSCNL